MDRTPLLLLYTALRAEWRFISPPCILAKILSQTFVIDTAHLQKSVWFPGFDTLHHYFWYTELSRQNCTDNACMNGFSFKPLQNNIMTSTCKTLYIGWFTVTVTKVQCKIITRTSRSWQWIRSNCTDHELKGQVSKLKAACHTHSQAAGSILNRQRHQKTKQPRMFVLIIPL